VIFCANGVTLVAHDGEQQPDLQRPWAQAFAGWMESQGADPAAYSLRMPDGQHARFFRTFDGRWNWRFE
jgi:hypothetical protein